MKYRFEKNQTSENFKDIYVNYAFYNNNIYNVNCDVGLNTILTNHF
jgi:hypothetical protein